MLLAHSLSLCIILLALALISLAPAQGEVIKSGPPACPGVALTFDLCPVLDGSGYDQALIDYLIEHKIPATFFLSGRWIRKHDERVKELLRIPFFEIGTHGEVHAHLPMHPVEEQRQEILGPVRLLKAKYGRHARLFRPPYGEFNDETVEAVQALGLQLILWNIESGDPDPTLSAEQIDARLKRLVRKGGVIVMHANGKGKHTREVVEHLAEQLLPQRRLMPMTVTDLMNCKQTLP